MTTTNYRDQLQAAAKAGDFETFHRLTSERLSELRAAVDRGIEGRVVGRELTPLEREAVHTAVDRLADVDLEEVPLESVEAWARWIAEDAVKVKLELAYNLEMDLTNGDTVEGGVLGKALDRVIEELLPYAEKSGGWYLAAMGRAET